MQEQDKIVGKSHQELSKMERISLKEFKIKYEELYLQGHIGETEHNNYNFLYKFCSEGKCKKCGKNEFTILDSGTDFAVMFECNECFRKR